MKRPAASTALGVGMLAVLAYLPALASSPGLMPADTKLYLYLDPGRLMGDAASAWDPRQFAGWVPHQIVAYLWPQGPWFWLGDAAGLPDWLTHRLWIGTLLFTAGTGARWFARQLGLPWLAATVCGVAYMLSPYILPYISRTSAMLLPFAALGWLMGLALRSVEHNGRWREPALIALVVATVGAPNATALLMIVPGPVLVLLHRTQRTTWRVTTRVAVRTAVLSLAVSAWWVVMLLVQRRYGADLLGYSESLEAVSYTSTSLESWRSLGYWLFYVRDPYSFTTTASIPYAESGRIILTGALLIVLALIGLSAVRWAHRRLAALLVAVGVLTAVGAHPIDAPAPLLRPFVDSGLSLALRSSTRAVPLSALGLALGLGALASMLGGHSWRRAVVANALVAVLVLANMPSTYRADYVDPALTRQQEPPPAWLSAAAALDAGNRSSRVLQLPGQEFGAFTWGYTVDPPLPGLTEKPLVTRDLLPLGAAAAMDLLYAFDNRIQAGTLDPASIAPLARLFGADTLWLSNDIDVDRFRTIQPSALNDAVDRAPDVRSQADYGVVEPTAMRAADEAALAAPVGILPQVTLRRIEQPTDVVRTATETVVVVGNGDGVVDAAAVGLLSGHEAVLYAAALPDSLAKPPDSVVLTDSNRRRAMHWRGSQDTIGMTESAAVTTPGVLEPDDGDHRLPVFSDAPLDAYTTAALADGWSVAASAYGEPFAYRPEQRAAMAVDGDPRTAWQVGEHTDPVGEYLLLSPPKGTQLTTLTVLQPQTVADRSIAEVIVERSGTSRRVTLDERSRTSPGQLVEVPGDGPVRVTIARVAPSSVDDFVSADAVGGVSPVGFAELGIGPVAEWVTVPRAPSGFPAAPVSLVFSRERTDPLDRWRSDPEPVLRRMVTLPAPTSGTATVTVRLDHRATDAQLLAAIAPNATSTTATSRLTGSLAHNGWFATDGNLDTAWTSSFGQSDAVLTIPVSDDGRARRVTLRQPVDGRYSTITAIEVSADGSPGTTHALDVDANGLAFFDLPPAVRQWQIRVADTDQRTTIDRRYADTVVLPVSIVELQGLTTPLPEVDHDDTCMPLLTIDGNQTKWRIGGPARQALLAGQAVTLTPCDDNALTIDAGERRIESTTGVIQVDRFVLDASTESDRLPPREVELRRTRTSLDVRVPPCPDGCWLIVGEGWSPGWRATINGVAAPPPELVSGFNGWWIPPTIEATLVDVQWSPQKALNWALFGSLVAVATCLLLAALGRARTGGQTHGADHVPTSDDTPSTSAGRLGYDTELGAPASWADSGIAASVIFVGALAVVGVDAGSVVVAAAAALVVLLSRRTSLLPVAAACIVMVLFALVISRQLHDRSFANAAWPRRFDDLHRSGLFAVLLVLAGAITMRRCDSE